MAKHIHIYMGKKKTKDAASFRVDSIPSVKKYDGIPGFGNLVVPGVGVWEFIYYPERKKFTIGAVSFSSLQAAADYKTREKEKAEERDRKGTRPAGSMIVHGKPKDSKIKDSGKDDRIAAAKEKVERLKKSIAAGEDTLANMKKNDQPSFRYAQALEEEKDKLKKALEELRKETISVRDCSCQQVKDSGESLEEWVKKVRSKYPQLGLTDIIYGYGANQLARSAVAAQGSTVYGQWSEKNGGIVYSPPKER